MARIAVAVMAVLLAPLPAVAGPQASALPEPTGYVTVFSEAGDWLGGGVHATFLAPYDEISVRHPNDVESAVTVDAWGDFAAFSFTFSGRSGSLLTEGRYPLATRHPFQPDDLPGMSVGNIGLHRGCNTLYGNFTVHQITEDLSRLWITYEQHCEGAVPAIFGEIRIGIPAGESTTLVAAKSHHWPAGYVGVPGRTTPVYFYNLGQVPVTLESINVVAGADDFEVRDSHCGLVDPGDGCAIDLGFTSSEPGRRLGALEIVDSIGRGHHVALAGSGHPGITYFEAHSDPNDWIGQGEEFLYEPQEGLSISPWGHEDRSVHFRIFPPSGDVSSFWWADFVAPEGVPLRAGQTYEVDDVPLDSGASMTISYGHRGCTPTGTFTVHEIAFIEPWLLDRLKLTFEMHCDGYKPPALTGDFSYRATDPAPPPADTVGPATATSITHDPGLGKTEISWTNPGDSDWVDTVVRGAVGTQPPASPDSGDHVYLGRGGSATAIDIRRDRPYSLSFFTRDTSGNYSVTTRVVPATVIDVRLPRKVVYGDAVAVTVELTDPTSGEPLAGKAVTLFKHKFIVDDWTWVWVPLVTKTTDEGGTISHRLVPERSTTYRATFSGGGLHLGSISDERQLLVARRVSLEASATRGPVGKSFTLATTVAPASPRASVELEELVDGRWKELDQAITVRGEAAFKVTPRRGRHHYRVVAGGHYDYAKGVSPTIEIVVR